MAGTPRRVGGRTLIDLAPDQLIWVLLARESTDRERQLDNQLTDLRAEVVTIGGRIDREIPENAVSAFKRQRVEPCPMGPMATAWSGRSGRRS